MATIYVYNPDTNGIERYTRGDNESMPYIVGNTLTVREFRAVSCSSVLWTDKRAMQAWNTTRRVYGQPIYVGYAFRRIWEGGHAAQSQHYSGVAFDVAQNLTTAGRAHLRNLASNTGAWTYVEPEYLTPTWVHLDRRSGPPACATGGYPLLKQWDSSNYVFILQDALATLGFTGGGLDGIFGRGTRDAVVKFQNSSGLGADGIVGCNTWRALTQKTIGIGASCTTINGCNRKLPC